MTSWCSATTPPFLFLLRRSLPETEAFAARQRHPQIAEVLASLRSNWQVVLNGAGLVVMTTVSFYSLAPALFGGFTPLICTSLIHTTHNPAIPGAWLSVAAGCGLVAALLGKGREESV